MNTVVLPLTSATYLVASGNVQPTELEGTTHEVHGFGPIQGPMDISFGRRFSGGGSSVIYDANVQNDQGDIAVHVKVYDPGRSESRPLFGETPSRFSEEFFYQKVLYDELVAEGRGREQYLVRPLSVGNLGRSGENPVDFIVFEKVEARDLKKLIYWDDPSLKLDPSLYVLSEVAGILSVYHELGYVHGDLKPSHILLYSFGGIKLIDFGIAGRINRLPVGALFFTENYQSPEHLRRQSPSGKSDVFSLAAIGIEMLTGEHWYRESDYYSSYSTDDLENFVDQREHIDYIDSLPLPKSLRSTLIAAMEPDHTKRITMGEFEKRIRKERSKLSQPSLKERVMALWHNL